MKRFFGIGVLALLLTGVAAQHRRESPYDIRWKNIDRLIEDALPQSALADIGEAYRDALKDNAYGHLLKAIRLRNVCLQMLESDPYATIIRELLQDAEHTPEPAKSVVRSLIAEAFRDYFIRNRRRLAERTPVVGLPASDDIATWSAVQVLDTMKHYLHLSLQSSALLQQTPVGTIREAFTETEDTRRLRPTLYDFLAHRAIELLTNPDIVQYDFSIFVINRPEFFADAEGFAGTNIRTDDDTTASTWSAMKILQDLTVFHMKQGNLNALTDVCLKRLKFVFDNGIYDDADALYENALKHLLEICRGQKMQEKVTSTLAEWYVSEGHKWANTGDEKYRRRLADAVQLYEGLLRHTSGEDKKNTKTILDGLKEKTLRISLQKEQLPHKPILAMVSYRNTDEAYVTVYRLNQKTLSDFENSRQEDTYRAFLSAQQRLSQQRIRLPKQTDYQLHNVEVRIDAPDVGQYIVVLSDCADMAGDKPAALSYAIIQTSRIFLMQRFAGQGKMEACVTDRESGHPLENVEIRLFKRLYNREKSAFEEIPDTVICTNAEGQAFYAHTPDNKILYLYHGNDSLMQPAAYGYSVKPVKDTEKLMLLTDRAIYRPGQTLYFKGLLYKGNDDKQQTVSGASVQVWLTDANGKELARQVLTSNDFGSFSSSMTIPHGLLNGWVALRSSFDGYASIRVEEYKRPTFEITVHPVRTNHALGDSVRITGEVKELAGYAVDNAVVRYVVTRRTQYRPVRHDAYTIIPTVRTPDRQVALGTLRTTDTGEFALTFKAEDEDIRDKRQIYTYELQIDVTDGSGETQSASHSIRLSDNPLQLNAHIPEQVRIGVDSLKYRLDVTNLDNVSTPAEVRVELYALQSPPRRLLRPRLWTGIRVDTVAMPYSTFVATFPSDVFGNEDNPYSYPKTGLAAAWSVNTASATEINLDELAKLPNGNYLLKFAAHNEQGSIADSMSMTVQHVDSAILRMNQWIMPLKTEGEHGDSAVFFIAGGQDGSFVRCDVLFNDRVVEQKILNVGAIPQKFCFPIKEEYFGGFAVQFAMVRENRFYSELHEIKVSRADKELDVVFQSFRSRLLPGEKEKWTLTVKNKQNGAETAEMAITLYDAALETFLSHSWQRVFHAPSYHGNYVWYKPYANLQDRTIVQPLRETGSIVGLYGNVAARVGSRAVMKNLDTGGEVANPILSGVEIVPVIRDNSQNIPLRTNFAETGFFYPALRTNEKGEITVEFTIPDALTRWNMLGFAHTKDFKTSFVTHSLVTQKQIAVSAHLPRFFRQGDTLLLSAKVHNLMEADHKATVTMHLYDAFTMQSVDAKILKSAAVQTVQTTKGQSAGVQWKLVLPDDMQALSYRLTAQAGNYTDGEERSVPALSGRLPVTEAMPFMVRGNGKADFRFDKLADNTSGTLQHKRLTLEYAADPAWYALQALPSLMENAGESTEQAFARFYANSVAQKTVGTPRIRQMFEQWRSIPDSKALLSNLEKNQELKQTLLAETPWVTQAASESERKKRIGLLFDVNRTEKEQVDTWNKLKLMQSSNGGFAWIAGMPEDRHITQHIVSGMEHLRQIGALPRIDGTNDVIERAMEYCDARIMDDYSRAQAQPPVDKKRQIDPVQLHYLYMCSFSQRRLYGNEEAFKFYMAQAEEYWTRFNLYEQAMTAIFMHRYGKTDVAQTILRSLKERAQTSDEMGMYWDDNQHGCFWYESPVATQVMLIEAFNALGSDTQAVEEMKLWLLRNKQTNEWSNTKTTTDAVHALLANDYDLFEESGNPLEIRIGGKSLKKAATESLTAEAGSGYVRTSWSDRDITPSMASLRVVNPNNNTTWGAMYWQYLEDADKVTSAGTQLAIGKQLFVRRAAPTGKTLTPFSRLNVGDVVTVRLEIRADRDFEYVHLKDLRAATLEPVKSLSGYRMQGGLSYYESVKDISVNFYIRHLPKGVYVIEYDLRVTHAGDCSNGIASIQCMYAPEFNAHSEGKRILSQ
ncbi:MAG: hypothetical protein LBS09_00840 [Bacteroidales bacterium]|jgi:uncharacterized protein YfaS (alpha-2-macroglobulin family)|nr:hypothetical protein [Bacteroidales bacterium]